MLKCCIVKCVILIGSGKTAEMHKKATLFSSIKTLRFHQNDMADVVYVQPVQHFQHSLGPWNLASFESRIVRGSGGTAYRDWPPPLLLEATSPTHVYLPIIQKRS